MCRANTLVDLAQKVFGETGPSTQKLQQLAAKAKDEQLAGIPQKYWEAVRALPKVSREPYLIYSLRILTPLQVIKSRNQAAHESEIEFARLLVLEVYKDEYHFWKDAFPLLYDGSIEEVAARKEESDIWDSLKQSRD